MFRSLSLPFPHAHASFEAFIQLEFSLALSPTCCTIIVRGFPTVELVSCSSYRSQSWIHLYIEVLRSDFLEIRSTNFRRYFHHMLHSTRFPALQLPSTVQSSHAEACNTRTRACTAHADKWLAQCHACCSPPPSFVFFGLQLWSCRHWCFLMSFILYAFMLFFVVVPIIYFACVFFGFFALSISLVFFSISHVTITKQVFEVWTLYTPLTFVSGCWVICIRAKNQLARVIYLMHCHRVLTFL